MRKCAECGQKFSYWQSLRGLFQKRGLLCQACGAPHFSTQNTRNFLIFGLPCCATLLAPFARWVLFPEEPYLGDFYTALSTLIPCYIAVAFLIPLGANFEKRKQAKN